MLCKCIKCGQWYDVLTNYEQTNFECQSCYKNEHVKEYTSIISKDTKYDTILKFVNKITALNNIKYKKIDSILHKYYTNKQISSKKRGISWEFNSFNDFYAFWEAELNICYYCGMTIKQFIYTSKLIKSYKGQNKHILDLKRLLSGSTLKHFKKMTLERIDNKKGYNINNCVKACYICNNLKGTQSHTHLSKFKKLVHRLKNGILR